MRARIKDFLVSFDRKQYLTLELDRDEDFRAQFDELNGKDLSVDVKPYRKKRSLNANAYCWVLLGKLAEKLDADPLELYRHYIRQIGVFQVVEISTYAVNTLCHSWGLHGKGWISEVLDHGSDDKTTLVRLFYGSSAYNTRQMSRLIDSIIEDCKEQGIETMTPDEIAKLISRWSGE